MLESDKIMFEIYKEGAYGDNYHVVYFTELEDHEKDKEIERYKGIYKHAVRGRGDFRNAFRKERNKNQQLETELAEARGEHRRVIKREYKPVGPQEIVLGWWRTGDESGPSIRPYNEVMSRNWYTHIKPLPSPPESGEGEGGE